MVLGLASQAVMCRCFATERIWHSLTAEFGSHDSRIDCVVGDRTIGEWLQFRSFRRIVTIPKCAQSANFSFIPFCPSLEMSR